MHVTLNITGITYSSIADLRSKVQVEIVATVGANAAGRAQITTVTITKAAGGQATADVSAYIGEA